MTWADKYQRAYDGIVHNLRSQGWSREDAIFEADEKISKWMEREDQNGNGTETATETVNCTVNSENALDGESEKT